MTHLEAIKMVHGKTKKNSRKVGNNTYAEILEDNSVGIMLHDTYVVKIHPDNSATLNSDGWQTSTTKDRINKYSPVRVCQRRGEWYVDTISSSGCTNLFPFYDGIVVSDKSLIC